MRSPIVPYDPVYFAALFPEFAGIANTTAPGYFVRAGFKINNSGNGIIPFDQQNTQKYLVHLATAHIAELFDPTSDRGSTQAVGRIGGGEGSVKVTLDMGKTVSAEEAYWRQTKYGTELWSATSQYRGITYIPNRSGDGHGLSIPVPPFLGW